MAAWAAPASVAQQALSGRQHQGQGRGLHNLPSSSSLLYMVPGPLEALRAPALRLLRTWGGLPRLIQEPEKPRACEEVITARRPPGYHSRVGLLSCACHLLNLERG